MSVSEATHAYVGRARCGHVFFLVVDDGEKSNATEIGNVLRKGGTIERVEIAVARKLEWCKCSKAARWAVKS